MNKLLQKLQEVSPNQFNQESIFELVKNISTIDLARLCQLKTYRNSFSCPKCAKEVRHRKSGGGVLACQSYESGAKCFADDCGIYVSKIDIVSLSLTGMIWSQADADARARVDAWVRELTSGQVAYTKATPEPPAVYPHEEALALWCEQSAHDYGIAAARGLGVDGKLCAYTDTPPWAGYNLMIPLRDAQGKLQSLVLRCGHQCTPKALSLRGRTSGLCFANKPVFGDKADELIVTEGEIDFLTANALYPNQAIIGIRSGALNDTWVPVLRKFAKVLSFCHADVAGDNYNRTLKSYLLVDPVRYKFHAGKDLNDMYIEGTLP